MRARPTARDQLENDRLERSTSIVITSRARLLAVCAMLSLALPDGALASDPQIKPPIRGLVSMGAYRFVGSGGDPINTLEPLNAKAGIFGGLVIIATWKQLQPTPTSEIGENNVIDRALADVRAYNARNPAKPLAVKLRVWGGFEAPDWAMRLGGAPIPTEHNGKQRILGRFWSEPYRQAWSRLQVQLAVKYDALPLIREVAITSCMSFTAEPFFLPTEPTVANPLRAAGYTDTAHRQCLEHAVADYAPWKGSRLVLSLNPFYGLSGRRPGDAAFTEQVMRSCRLAVGRRCVFDNHDLDANPPKSLLPIYAVMQKMGPEIEFQTLHTTPEDFEGTIKKGVSLGASSIELWQDYQGFPLVPDATLKRWATMIEGQ
jgi:hypothetical protein